MCCLVLATESGLRLSPDCDWVRTVSESGPWLSLDRDWVWIVTETGPWLSLVRDRGWSSLVRDRGWLCLDPEGSQPVVGRLRLARRSEFPVAYLCYQLFENPSLENDIPTSDSWVTCYPVFYCERHGDISIFLSFICVTVFVCIRRYIASLLHVRVE